MECVCYKGMDLAGFTAKFEPLFGEISTSVIGDTLICVYDDFTNNYIDDEGVMHINCDSFGLFTVIFMKSFKKYREDKSLKKFLDNLYEGITGDNYGSA